MAGLAISVDGIDCSDLTLKRITPKLPLGQPSTLSLTLEDQNLILPRKLEHLCDVRVGPLPGRDDYLFWGQLTNDDLEGLRPGLRHEITAEGWMRLAPKSKVAPLLTSARTVTHENDVSLVNEDPYDTSAGTAEFLVTDGDIIRDLLTLYWEGPPLDLSAIEDLGPKPDPPIRWSNVGLDQAIGELISRLVSTGAFWIDQGTVSGGLAAHYTAFFGNEPGDSGIVDLGDLPLGLPEIINTARAPYRIGLTHDPANGIILPMYVREGNDHGAAVRAITVSGRTPWSVATVEMGPLYGGVESISANTVDHAGSEAIAYWAFGYRQNPRLTVPVRIPAGYDGWQPGQVISITEPDLYPAERHFVVRQVDPVLTVPGNDPPEIEYLLACGDIERRSLVYELADAVETVIDRTIHMRVEISDPAPNVDTSQQIRAYPIEANGSPTKLPKGRVQWTLVVNGDAVGIGNEDIIKWWLTGDLLPGEAEYSGLAEIDPDSNYAYVTLSRGDTPTTDYWDVTCGVIPT